MGMNKIPTTKNVGNTVLGVSTGCQAGNFCWLKGPSISKQPLGFRYDLDFFNMLPVGFRDFLVVSVSDMD